MPVFATREQLERTMVSLWERIKTHDKMREQLITSRLSTQFRYRDPEFVLTIDCSDGKEMKIIPGEYHGKPTIEMSMKADVAHDFWMGRVTVPVAILTGKIVSKGPTPKALALLPVIRPAFAFYEEIFEKARTETKVSS